MCFFVKKPCPGTWKGFHVTFFAQYNPKPVPKKRFSSYWKLRNTLEGVKMFFLIFSKIFNFSRKNFNKFFFHIHTPNRVQKNVFSSNWKLWKTLEGVKMCFFDFFKNFLKILKKSKKTRFYAFQRFPELPVRGKNVFLDLVWGMNVKKNLLKFFRE